MEIHFPATQAVVAVDAAVAIATATETTDLARNGEPETR